MLEEATSFAAKLLLTFKLLLLYCFLSLLFSIIYAKYGTRVLLMK